MKKIPLLFIVLLTCISSFAQKTPDRFFNDADKFFRKYVWDGKVDYAAVIDQQKLLNDLMYEIATFKIDGDNAERSKSFYINAYNLLVIRTVAMHYPMQSVKQLEGFFTDYKFRIAGEQLTLNAVQFEKLRQLDNDDRVLFALSTASVSSPKIFNAVLSHHSQLNIDLDERMRSVMNDASFVIVNDNAQTVQVSLVFNWYAKNLETISYSTINYINKYRNKKIPSNYKLTYFEYDWSLNDKDPLADNAFEPMQKANLLAPHYSKIAVQERLTQPQYGSQKINKLVRDSVIKNDSTIKNYDEELGFRNESRYIEKGAYEVRATDKFYTQTDFYNTRMLRTASEYRTTYNRGTLQGTHAFTSKFQGGLLFNAQHLYNGTHNSKATDFFSQPAADKFHNSELQFFGKIKWCEKKFRLSTLSYISIPLTNKRLNDKVSNGAKSYDVAAQLLYDRYPTFFMRMILGAEFKLHYFIVRETTSLDFNPTARFIFTLLRTRPLKLSAVMDLNWSANKDNVNPFAGTESIVAAINVFKNCTWNIAYQYYFIGESTGAGHSFRTELLFAF